MQNKGTYGFSTIEMLVAFAIMALAFTGIITVVFGNDNFAIDTQLNSEGLYYAERDLNEARKQVENNFLGFAGSTSTDDNGRFKTEVGVEPISACSKNLISTTLWDRTALPSQRVTLTTIVTSLLASVEQGGNCEPFPPEPGWDTPSVYSEFSQNGFDGQGTGIAYAFINGKRYAFLTTDADNNPNLNNLYVIDTADFDPGPPPSGIDDNYVFGSKVGTKALNGIAVANINGSHYAFVLYNATSTQLRVFDVSTDPTAPLFLASTTIPYVTPGESAYPRSIYYRNENGIEPRIYIGTDYLLSGDAGENEEFHIFDVSSPSSPSWGGSINVDRNVNDIAVRDGLAYLAIGQGNPPTPYDTFRIYDISTESEEGSFSTPIDRPGTALYLLDQTVYLGLRGQNNQDSFYRIDIGDPENPVQVGEAADLENNNSDVGGIVVQYPLAFIGIEGSNAQSNFQVLAVSNPDEMKKIYPNCESEGSPFAQNLSELVYVDDLIFASSRSNLGFKLIWDTDEVVTCE